MIGAIVALGSAHSLPGKVIGVSALILATVNAVGGFVVTDRMLGMFRRRRRHGDASDPSGPGGESR
jgi:NAD(P) transhydrogenase subunit alpha